jgi:hypothetical protein
MNFRMPKLMLKYRPTDEDNLEGLTQDDDDVLYV